MDTATSQAAIILGKKCLEDEFPSSVEIWAEAIVDMPPIGTRHISSFLCGGTLVKSNVVVTAAHCLLESSLTRGMGTVQYIRYGIVTDLDLREAKRLKKPSLDIVWAKDWTAHEGYPNEKVEKGLKKGDDIGVLILSEHMKLPVTPWLKHDEKDLLTLEMPAYIVGWGQQNVDTDSQDPATISNKMCAVSNIHELGEFELQIGAGEDTPRKCHGDSGGATYIKVKDGSYRLVGVTSRSYGAIGCAEGGVDTRIDAYDQWLQKQINMI
ncbi:MAG: trypsin-like serine protease [Myxococcota bacterium]